MLNKAPPGTDGRQKTVLAVPRGNFLVPLMFLSDCHWVLLSRSLFSAGASAAWYPGAVGRVVANPATGRAWGVTGQEISQYHQSSQQPNSHGTQVHS